MEKKTKTVITIENTINAPAKKVWDYWTKPEHIINWNYAIDEWHSPKADNDIKPGGKFNYRMEAKDGSVGFDFSGVYDEVNEHKYIEYTLADDRKVKIHFSGDGNATTVVEMFEAEETNPAEMQQQGWQSILDNFKNYTENN